MDIDVRERDVWLDLDPRLKPERRVIVEYVGAVRVWVKTITGPTIGKHSEISLARMRETKGGRGFRLVERDGKPVGQ